MTRETKAGLVVSCSFLCLVGVVLFNKVNENQTNGTDRPSEKELAQLMEEPQLASPGDPSASPGTASTAAGSPDNHEKANKPGPVVPAVYREPDSFKIDSKPPSVKPETALAGGASQSSKVESVPDGLKSKTSPDASRLSEPPLMQPPTTVVKEDDKPASSLQKAENVAPTMPFSILKKVIKTNSACKRSRLRYSRQYERIVGFRRP